jgi:hypothetical protein
MKSTSRASIHAPLAVLVGAAMALVGAPRSAYAEDATLTACIAANEGSIQRRAAHDLLEARAQALQCAVDACPALLRDACKKRVDQVNAALPTVVFDVKDASGADVAVKVSMDGKPLDTPQGAAVVANPGEHRFAFEVAGQPPLEKQLILREGEKDRREAVVVGSATSPTATATGGGASPAGGAPASLDTATRASGWSTQKTLAVVAGGVGVAGIALGSVFGWMAHTSWEAAHGECPSATSCAQHAQAVSDHDSASSSATISTVAFVAAAAAVTGGAVLWLTAPRVTARAESARVAKSPRLGVAPAGAGLLLTGEF